jgi:hypothetical protein
MMYLGGSDESNSRRKPRALGNLPHQSNFPVSGAKVIRREMSSKKANSLQVMDIVWRFEGEDRVS